MFENMTHASALTRKKLPLRVPKGFFFLGGPLRKKKLETITKKNAQNMSCLKMVLIFYLLGTWKGAGVRLSVPTMIKPFENNDKL